MARDRESAAIVDAISKLGDSLGLPVTAEGDRGRRDPRRSLRALGCAKGQGWHFGRPLPIAATRRLLAERGLLPSARGLVTIERDGAHRAAGVTPAVLLRTQAPRVTDAAPASPGSCLRRSTDEVPMVDLRRPTA